VKGLYSEVEKLKNYDVSLEKDAHVAKKMTSDPVQSSHEFTLKSTIEFVLGFRAANEYARVIGSGESLDEAQIHQFCTRWRDHK